MLDHLDAEGRLAAALLAEDDGGRGRLRIADDLVPRRVKRVIDSALAEDAVFLRVFLAERIFGEVVVTE
jgi:hypothetical protein